jgi:hypothetical protein
MSEILPLVMDETIRLQALGNSLKALALAEGIDFDPCQMQEMGQMVYDLAKQVQDKLIALDRENYQREKEARKEGGA